MRLDGPAEARCDWLQVGFRPVDSFAEQRILPDPAAGSSFHSLRPGRRCLQQQGAGRRRLQHQLQTPARVTAGGDVVTNQGGLRPVVSYYPRSTA